LKNKNPDALVGVIAIDSIYTPIKNVKYTIENYRVEQKTDYEKLVLDIVTDGSVHPEHALKEAAKILIQHFMLFSDENMMLEAQAKEETKEVDEEILHMRKILKTELVDLDLSVRALNCLKAADIRSLADLVSYDVADMLKFRNFGKKSLTEIQDLVKSKGLSFGMNLAKYKLDEE
jgi:DNA-directed RNA polymerase subunit alpha